MERFLIFRRMEIGECHRLSPVFPYREQGPVSVNFREWKSKIRVRKPETFGEASAAS